MEEKMATGKRRGVWGLLAGVFLLWSVPFLPAFAGDKAAQASTGVYGTVTDLGTGSALINAAVSTTGASAYTGVDGTYEMELNPGVYDVTFSKTGYQTVTIRNVLVIAGNQTEQNVLMTTPGPLNITTTSLPSGETGVAYNAPVRISGGTFPYTWTLQEGTLPPGLALDADYGNISGTPTTKGFYSFSVRVSDAAGAYAQAAFTIEITVLLAIITDSPLTRGQKGMRYFQSIEAVGGTVPYTFSKWAGTLPDGLSLSSAGALSGTPAGTGAWDFTVKVTDISARTDSKSFHVEIDNPLLITTSRMDDGISGQAYTQTLTATGGYGSYTWALSSGILPAGLAFDTPSATLAGTPTEATYGTIVFSVTDGDGRVAYKDLIFQVADPLQFLTTDLPDGLVNEPYSESIRTSGGVAPLVSSYAGQLPAGLTLGKYLQLTEDFETGGLNSGWSTGGDGLWTVQSETVFQGMYAARSPSGLGNSQSSYLQTTLNVLTEGEVSFWYRVSSENDDYLRFTVDGNAMGAWSGEVGWTKAAFSVPAGTHTLRWEYDKDSSYSAGDDAAWLDYIVFPPTLYAPEIVWGVPTAAGVRNVDVTMADSAYPISQSVTRSIGFKITDVLTILTSAVLPAAKKGVTVNPLIMQAAGGPSPHTWAVVGGYMPEGIALNSQTGELSGTPLNKGDFTFTIQVTDAGDATAQKQFFLHVSDDLSISTGVLPDGAKDVGYNFVLEATGGLLPYTWRLKTGTLPSGLTLNTTTGAIYGTPTTRQTYSFTVEVNDSDSPAQTAQKTYTMEVLDGLYVYTETIPNGRIDEAYTAAVSARLGKPPYSWRLESGTLPTGLSLTSSPTTVVVAGTPSAAGTFPFTLEVRDTGTPVKTATQTFTVNVYGDVAITNTGINCAYRGVPYSAYLTASGGALPYTWRLTGGSLPTGLVLNSGTGHISGITDLAVGQSATFTVRVMDSGSPYGWDEKELTIQVVNVLGIITQTIQNGMQNSSYEATLTGQGGISPYHWSVISGAMPAGMTLGRDTGIIACPPMTCGTFSFTVQLADSASVPNTATRTYSMTVVCAPHVFVNPDDAACNGNTPCYTSIQTAVNAADTGTVIMITKGTYTEAITLNTSKSLTLQGGWNAAYDQQTFRSTVIKAPRALQGALRLQEVMVEP